MVMMAFIRCAYHFGMHGIPRALKMEVYGFNGLGKAIKIPAYLSALGIEGEEGKKKKNKV